VPKKLLEVMLQDFLAVLFRVKEAEEEEEALYFRPGTDPPCLIIIWMLSIYPRSRYTAK
jgi:hypothetical protein